MATLKKLGGTAAILAALMLGQPVSVSRAAVQTLVASGVDSLVDNVPGYGDPTLMWTTMPECNSPGPSLQGSAAGVGVPGDELSPALITRASVSIATPRTIFSFNPVRPEAFCNPYRLLSRVHASGNDLYFIDNTGPGGHAALRRLSRDANAGDAPQLIADLGTIGGGQLLVYGPSIFAILGDDDGDHIVQYNKDTGELINGFVEFPADRGTLGNLHHDGRFLYWTSRGALRRNDTFNGSIETVLNGPIESLYVYGYDELCDPDGCTQLSRIVYGQNNGLYEAETISGQVFPLYTSPVANAHITAVERDPTHYYFIERRPVTVFTSDDRFFRLGVGDEVPALIYGPVYNGGMGFDGFRTDLVWLYFRDRAQNSLLRLSTDEAAIPVRDLRARGLEISQGLQNTANDLRLIADKRTIVRFYVRSGRPEDVVGVTASLAGSNAQGFLGRLEPINAGGKLITVRQTPTRTNLDHSFQFELPLHWTEGGPLTLTATVNPAERIIEDTVTNNSSSRTVDFTPSPRLLVIFYNWSYDLGGVRYTPVADDVARSRRRMRRLYPLGEPGNAFESPGLHTVVLDFVDNELTDQVDRTDAACVKRYKKADDRNMCASDYVHARMATLRRGSGIAADTVSYGNIAQAAAPMGANYFTRGYANGQFASGPSTDPNYASHEVGHTLGRQHPFRGALKCGHSATDTNYPYGGAFIDETPNSTIETRYAGLNFFDELPGTMLYLDANSQYDTMAYCTPNWISDYTFEGMYQYLISDTRPRAATQPRGDIFGDWLILSGTLMPDEDQGGFVLVQRTNTVTNANSPEPGDFTLEQRDDSGDVLDSLTFAGAPVEEQPGKFVFDFVVALAPGTTELRVIDNNSGNVLATHAVSANMPLVSDVELPDAPNPVDGIVTVTWNASDDDGDELRFDIFASRVGDPMFRPIHLGISGNTVELDTSLLGGGINVLRVVASDGTNTAFAESAPFTVSPRPPRIVITSPVNGFQADWGQLITLQAEIDDVQDGIVTNVQWRSDKAGVIGSGAMVQTDQLPVGENILSVTATNSVGESSSATITVHVGDVLAAAGPTLALAPQAIAWHVANDETTTQSANLTVDNHGGGTLVVNVISDANWLLIDSATSVDAVDAPRTFTITADPSQLPLGITSHATLTVQNVDNPNDVVTVPVELSRGNVFDHTGEEPLATCAGDCDDGGSVTVDELVRAVNIALERIELGECDAVDVDGDGQASINELVLAVNAALGGC